MIKSSVPVPPTCEADNDKGKPASYLGRTVKTLHVYHTVVGQLSSML